MRRPRLHFLEQGFLLLVRGLGGCSRCRPCATRPSARAAAGPRASPVLAVCPRYQPAAFLMLAVVGDIEQHVVAHDPLARTIASDGFVFSPGGQATAAARLRRENFARPSVVDGLTAADVIERRVEQPARILSRPVETAFSVESLDRISAGGQQVLNVFGGVIEVFVAQRPLGPVGTGMRFGHLDVEQFLDQTRVTHLAPACRAGLRRPGCRISH